MTPTFKVWVLQAGHPTHAVQAVYMDETEAHLEGAKHGWDVLQFTVEGDLIAHYMTTLKTARSRQSYAL